MRTRKMERNEALGETGKLWRRGEMGKCGENQGPENAKRPGRIRAALGEKGGPLRVGGREAEVECSGEWALEEGENQCECLSRSCAQGTGGGRWEVALLSGCMAIGICRLAQGDASFLPFADWASSRSSSLGDQLSNKLDPSRSNE